MKQRTNGLFRVLTAMIIALLLWGEWGATAKAGEALGLSGSQNTVLGLSGKMVSSWEELELWLAEDGNTQREITLGADIVVAGNMNLHNGGSRTIRIDTGSYGFIVQGRLHIADGVELCGEGNRRPVVEVLSGGEIFLTGSSAYDHAALSGLTVTGKNGCGLLLRENSRYDDNDFTAFELKALGQDSVAIRSEIPLVLQRLLIDAKGKQACGVISTRPVALYLSSIYADGEAVQAPEVYLDTCNIAPDPANIVQERYRRLSALEGAYLFDTQRVYAPVPEYLAGASVRSVAVLSAGNVDDRREAMMLQIRESGESVDNTVPGTYLYPGQMLGTLAAFAMEADCPVGVTLEYYDPRLPFCVNTTAGYHENTIVYDYTGGAGHPLKIWRSDDDGDTWYEWTDVEWEINNERLRIFVEKNWSEEAVVVVEVVGVGESEMIKLFSHSFGFGGDRRGYDRRGMRSISPQEPGEPDAEESGQEEQQMKNSEEEEAGRDTEAPPERHILGEDEEKAEAEEEEEEDIQASPEETGMGGKERPVRNSRQDSLYSGDNRLQGKVTGKTRGETEKSSAKRPVTELGSGAPGELRQGENTEALPSEEEGMGPKPELLRERDAAVEESMGTVLVEETARDKRRLAYGPGAAAVVGLIAVFNRKKWTMYKGRRNI